MAGRIYVETRVEAPLDVLWRRTQDPADHQRWDLRFTEIGYDEPPLPGRPRTFRYALRLGPLRIAGTGRTLGERDRPDGTRTSALGFGSPDPRSLICDGSGWWRYVPRGEAVRFLTGYDYAVRWGRFGRAVDRAAFRPWMGWATAWSFDRLRIWLEQGVPPETARDRWLADATVRAAAAGAALRAARRRPLAASALLAAAVALPAPPGVPRARRCLREPPDPGSVLATAPSTVGEVAP